MRTAYKALAVLAVLVIAFIPMVASDSDAATVERTGPCEASGFTDYDSGTLVIHLKNNDTVEKKLTVKIFEAGNRDNKYAEKEITIPESSSVDEKVSWKIGSSGTKYVDVIFFDADGNELTDGVLAEHSVTIEVSHSIWKNSVTYIVIVVVIIVILVAVILFIRSSKKTKADTTMADKTFTKMHEEKTSRKTAAAAEKKEYKSSGTRTRKK